MKVIKIFLSVVILSLMFSLFGCFKQGEKMPKGNGEDIEVIILLGQSNASGCSRVSYLDQLDDEEYNLLKKGLNNVFIDYSVDGQNISNKFVKVTMGYGTNTDYFGPELGMAKIFNKSLNRKIAIIKYTWGGTALGTLWYHHADGNGQLFDGFLNFFKDSIKRLEDLNYHPIVTDICFMQGESDCFDGLEARYFDELSSFVEGLRAELAPYTKYGLYFIDAFISDSIFWTKYQEINEAKEQFASLSPFNIVIDTIGAGLTYDQEPTNSPDLAHYDALSELKLGELFADAILNKEEVILDD